MKRCVEKTTKLGVRLRAKKKTVLLNLKRSRLEMESLAKKTERFDSPSAMERGAVLNTSD